MNILVECKIFCGNYHQITELYNEIKIFLDKLTTGYIWQKESLCLQIADQEGLISLCSVTDVGENINDEWFIVYIMYELSKAFPDIVIQITDEDGEFLLIEAAEELPLWIKPDSSKNRVFIHKDELYLIPFPSNLAEVTKYPTETPSYQAAVKLVLKDYEIKAAQQIQEVVKKKIKLYPKKIQQDFHHAHCYIPKDLAYVLHVDPTLVAHSVQAFYERDPLDIKICREMKTFGNSEYLTSNVKFTRYLYSQLVQANFIPERNSNWKLPPPNHQNFKAAKLGYKLTCGFEILLSRNIPSNTDKKQQPNGRLWEQYVGRLRKRGFFQAYSEKCAEKLVPRLPERKTVANSFTVNCSIETSKQQSDELEGSQRYQQLMEEAKTHFKENLYQKAPESAPPVTKIQNYLHQAKLHEDEINEILQNLPEEDSDDWMTITPEDLDRMLGKMWRHSNEAKADHLSDLVSGMNSFVEKISSYEGVELDFQDSVNEDSPIQFDPAVFMETIKNILEPPPRYPKKESHAGDDDQDDDEDEFTESGEDDEIMSGLMVEMDDELRSSSMAKSFQQNDENEELDIDYNLVKNMLESFSNQQGVAGPVSSLLRSMNIGLPVDDGTT